MNSYLAQFYTQPAGIIVFIQFIFLALGGYVSTQTPHGPQVLGRSRYFLGIMVYILFYAVLGYIWLLGMPLTTSGSTGLVVIGTMIGHGILGYMLGKIGVARSIDFSQHKKFGWFAFVPIVQLGLVFPKSLSVAAKDRNPYFSGLAIMVGILCFGLGLAIHLKAAEYLKQLKNSPQTMQESIEQDGLETAISKFVAGLDVPTRSLVGAQAFPTNLSLTYFTAGDIAEMSTLFATLKLEENCKNPVFGAIVDAGGEVVSIYITDNQREIGRIAANKSTCQQPHQE
jgi:hypothetical protein